MTDLIARLRLVADKGNVNQVVGEAKSQLDGLGVAGQNTGRGLGVAATASNRLDRELAGTDARARTAGRGLDQAAAGATRFDRSAGMARSASLMLGSALAGLTLREITSTIGDAAQETFGWSTGLGAVTGGAAGAAAEMGFLMQESDRLGLVVRDQVSSFMSLSGATNGTNLAGRDTREIWLGLVEAGTALSRSNEQMKRGQEAVSQIASKGVVSMEELRGQLAEAIPGAVQIAARAMDVTTGSLIEMVGEGKLASDVFLPKFAAQLRQEFGPALEEAMIKPLGIARVEMNETKNELFELQAVAGEAFLVAFTEGLIEANNALKDPDARQAAEDFGRMLGEGAAFAAGALGEVVENIDEVVAVAQTLAALGLGRWFAEVAADAARAGVTVVAQSRAMALAQEMEAKAARDAALAHEQAAAATLAQTRAQASSLLSTQTLAQKQAALALAERELAAARTASAATAKTLDAAALGNARALTTMGGAGALAARGLGGLSALMGGPLGIALMATTAGVWAVASAVQEADRVVEEGKASLEGYNSAMAQADSFLREAASASRDFGAANAGAVAGTDALAIATFKLASGKAELARQTLQAAIVANQERIEQVQNPGFWAKTGEVLMSMGSGGDTWEGGQATPGDQRAATRKAEVERLRARNAELQRKSLELVFNPASYVPDEAAKPPSSTAAGSDKKTKASDAEREAKRQLEAAADMERAARMETAALEAQAVAAGQGAAALETLRVKQAGLEVLQRLGVDSLDKLTGKQKEAAAAAIAEAQARERQAIATDKAQAVARTTDDLDRQIASERAYAAALQGGEKALADYAVAEAVRQEVERTGENLSEAQIAAIRQRVTELERLKAASEGFDDQRAFKEELRLAAMTADERQREVRVIELRNRYLKEGLVATEAEADARARIAASVEDEMRRRAADVSRLRNELRDAFIESGELGFDKVADYAERRLREAIYDSLLAKPIDMVINATVNVVGDAVGRFLGGKGGGTFMDTLASLLGGGTGSGGPSKMDNVAASLGKTASSVSSLVSSLASVMPIAMAGMAVNQMIGKAIGFDQKQMDAVKWGGVLAGLLVGKESNHGAKATFDDAGGFVVTGSKKTKETAAGATSAASAIGDMIDALDEMGIDAKGIVSSISVGTRDSSKLRLTNGQTVETPKGDMEALVRAAGKALLQNAEFKSPQMEKVVDQMLAANASFEEIASKLSDFVAAQKWGEDLKLELLKFTDERAYTLKVLENSQKERRDQVDDAAEEGFFTEAELADIRATLDALEDAELAAALERLGDSAAGAAKAFADAKPRLQEWLDRLGFNDSSNLNPHEQRQLALSQYDAQLALAEAGDVNALASITSYADRLLAADQDATSSAADRLALANLIKADIAGLVGRAMPADPVVAALEELITTVQGGTTAVTGAIEGSGTAVTDEIAAGLGDLLTETAGVRAGVGGLTFPGTVSVGDWPGLNDILTRQVVIDSQASGLDFGALRVAIDGLRSDTVSKLDGLSSTVGGGLAGLRDETATGLAAIRSTGQGTISAIEGLRSSQNTNNALMAKVVAR